MTRLDRALKEALRREAEAADYRPPSGAELARALGRSRAPAVGRVRAPAGREAPVRPAPARKAACLAAGFLALYASGFAAGLALSIGRKEPDAAALIGLSLPAEPGEGLYRFIVELRPGWPGSADRRDGSAPPLE